MFAVKLFFMTEREQIKKKKAFRIYVQFNLEKHVNSLRYGKIPYNISYIITTIITIPFGELPSKWYSSLLCLIKI